MSKEKDEDRLWLNVLHESYKFRMNIRKDASLKILIKKFCERTNTKERNMRFLIEDGRRIQRRDTANKLGLHDGDFIETFTIQDGGSGFFIEK